MNFSKITISGKICTGKTTLFKNLQKKLNWPVFSTSQYFRDLAVNKKLSLEKAEEQNEKITKETDFKVRDLLKSEGNLIAEGWMTGLMADGFTGVLKILLTADDRIRTERFSKREKIPFNEAERKIGERESNLFNKLSLIYDRKDFVDSQNYNLIIDTSFLVPAAVVKKVLARL